MQALQQQVGKRIRQLREQKGISQEGLAAICSLHRTYIGLIERGERNLSISTVEVIAQGLGVAPSELFAGIEASAQATAKVRPTKTSSLSDLEAHIAAIRQILIDAKVTDSRRYGALFKRIQKGGTDLG